MIYLYYFALAVILSGLLTPLIKRLAISAGALDIPRPPRNLHALPTPKLGGLVIFLTVVIASALYATSGHLNFAVLPAKFLWAILAAGGVLMIGGYLDDKFDLPPKIAWLFPAIASVIIPLAGIGVGIKFLSNPFGDPISLAGMVFGLPLSGIFIWVWLMGMMFTTKFLDGLDGLVAGIGLIGGLTLFALSLTETVAQPMTAMLAIILAGSLLGFLFYNSYPAKIFLGDGGSLFVGFLLGVLSIILGAKIATAFLVMGVPILDVAWVIVKRLVTGKSPFRGDRLHLHFRLLDLGFNQKQTALILYAISAVFGFTAVFLQSFGKLIALIVLFVVMMALISTVYYLYRFKQPQRKLF